MFVHMTWIRSETNNCYIHFSDEFILEIKKRQSCPLNFPETIGNMKI